MSKVVFDPSSGERKCLNCGEILGANQSGHFAPPSMGEPGFFICGESIPASSARTISKWDRRFMEVAKMVSSWSKDPSTQTGAVLVSPDRKDTIVGYNGFASRMNDAPALYENRELKYSRIVHCEMNALLQARRSVEGYTLYTWPCLSCDRCAVHMIQAGIVRVVGPKPTADMSSRWEPALVKTRSYFKEAGVEVVEYDLETGVY